MKVIRFILISLFFPTFAFAHNDHPKIVWSDSVSTASGMIYFIQLEQFSSVEDARVQIEALGFEPVVEDCFNEATKANRVKMVHFGSMLCVHEASQFTRNGIECYPTRTPVDGFIKPGGWETNIPISAEDYCLVVMKKQ